METKGLVSVIVPIYKTEQYLKKCVNSIIGQTYKDLEIILVNDGSPDNSLAIMQEYVVLDNRIKIVNKDNGGLSSARNAGLAVATGEYITFIDSDDYLEEEAVERLLDAISTYHGDIAVMKSKSVDENYDTIGEPSDSDNVCVFSSEEYLRDIFERKESCSVCNKLFHKHLWKNRRFKEDILNEDFLALSELLIDSACKLVKLDFYGYNYYTRASSISRNGFGKSSKDAVYNCRYIMEYIDVKNNQLFSYAAAFAAYQARTAIVIMSKDDFKNDKEFVQYCKETLLLAKKHVSKSFMNKKDRLFCIVFPYAPKLIFRLIKIFRNKEKK